MQRLTTSGCWLAMMLVGTTALAQPKSGSTLPASGTTSSGGAASAPATAPSSSPPSTSGTTSNGPPQTAADAPAHFQRALELYQEQDFAGALVEFRRAQELAPSYKMLYNIGQVCYALNDYACALRSFETYLKEGGGSVSSDRRAEVDRELAKLRSRVGQLEIVTNVPDVEISVDDVVVGKTPMQQTVIVSTGKRRITGTHEGYAPVSRVVEVAGTDSSRVELVFTNGGPGSGDVKYESRWNTISWIGTGVTIGLAAATAITGVVALNASNDLKDERFAAGQGPTSQMKSDQDRAKTWSTVSDVTLGVGIAALVGTVVYTLVHKPKVIESKPEPKTDSAKAAKTTLGVGFSGTGALLGGTF